MYNVKLSKYLGNSIMSSKLTKLSFSLQIDVIIYDFNQLIYQILSTDIIILHIHNIIVT